MWLLVEKILPSYQLWLHHFSHCLSHFFTLSYLWRTLSSKTLTLSRKKQPSWLVISHEKLGKFMAFKVHLDLHRNRYCLRCHDIFPYQTHEEFTSLLLYWSHCFVFLRSRSKSNRKDSLFTLKRIRTFRWTFRTHCWCLSIYHRYVVCML